MKVFFRESKSGIEISNSKERTSIFVPGFLASHSRESLRHRCLSLILRLRFNQFIPNLWALKRHKNCFRCVLSVSQFSGSEKHSKWSLLRSFSPRSLVYWNGSGRLRNLTVRISLRGASVAGCPPCPDWSRFRPIRINIFLFLYPPEVWWYVRPCLLDCSDCPLSLTWAIIILRFEL